jgi:hypothetical protein
MASPELQTVLTLTSGNSDQKTKTFRWGTAVPPIPVGTRAEWYVHAPGVLGVHIYVAFDGRMVHVAAAAGARVTVRGVEVGQEWTSVPVRTEVRFGEAAIAVTCEEVPREASPPNAVDAGQLGTGFTTAPPPSPGLVRTLIVREAKPPAAPVERKSPPPAAPATGAGPGNTRPMGVATSPVAVAPTVAAAAPPATPPPPAQPAVLPTAIISAAAFTPAGTPPGAPLRPVALEPPAPGDVPAPPALGESAPQYDSSPTTMMDGGALRDHAYRIASMPPEQAEAAAQEYAALVKRRAGRSDPPGLTMSFGSQPVENKREPVAAAAPPESPRAATPVVGSAKVVGLKERMAKSWKETSTVKKAILFLLPLAAAATLLERDPQPEEAPPAKQTQVSSATTAKHTTGETPSPATSGSAAQPAAPASAPAASTSAPATTSTAAPSAAVVAAAPVASASFATAPNPTKVAANDPAADKGKAPADDQPDPDQRASMLAHMALTAAFGGNLAQATQLYAKLAEVKPEAQVFALAARLTKEGAVRSP